MPNPLLAPVLGFLSEAELPAPVPAHRGAVRARPGDARPDSLRRRNPARPGHAAAGELEEAQGPEVAVDVDRRHRAADVRCWSTATATSTFPNSTPIATRSIARARAAGVTRQIVPAIEAQTGRGCARSCARDDGLVSGLRPASDADRVASRGASARVARVDRTRAPGRDRRMRAGLLRRRTWIATRRRTYFDGQLQLAREYDLPRGRACAARGGCGDRRDQARRQAARRGPQLSGSEEQARQLCRPRLPASASAGR